MGEGWRLDVDVLLGRIVVATRPFAIGDLVMTDSPLITFPLGDDASFLRSFSLAVPAVQAEVLDMCHPPLDKLSNAKVADTLTVAVTLDGSFGMSAVQIHKLLMIRATNAHQYNGRARGSVVRGGDSAHAALFGRGSKVAHSCLPNVAYSSLNTGGNLEYRACRAIALGDMISFSYIGDIWTKTTTERRAECLETKDFLCCCSRCIAPDALSTICCPVGLCGGFATPLVDPLSDGKPGKSAPRWLCDTCGPLSPDMLATPQRLERILMGKLFALKAQAHDGDCPAPSCVATLAELASKSLSPAHWLVALSYETLAMFYVHHATEARRSKERGIRKEPHGSEASLHEKAADAGGKHIRICECIAAGCRGGAECKDEHPPVYEKHVGVFAAAQELLQIRPRLRSTKACQMIARYMPHIESGYTPSEVAEVKQMLEESRPRSEKPSTSDPAQSETEVAADWLSGLGLGSETPCGTPRSSRGGGGHKKKGKSKR